MGLRERIHPRGVAATAAGLGLGAVIIAALASFWANPLPPAGPSAPLSSDELLDAFGAYDSDRDGLADSVENYRFGTDPETWNTAGSPIPDGWLARFGYDPLDSGIAAHPAAIPPRDAWPGSVGPNYPQDYQATLLDIYEFGRPAEWDEARQGPWDSRLDPTEWDANDDGIPDGFLLHYGLDPKSDIAGQRIAGGQGLTIREAYLNATDPTRLDTDGDGLIDRVELEGPEDPRRPGDRFAATDPRRFSTMEVGVCDGYLVSYGLDPHDALLAYKDLDKDGATTREEYNWSAAHRDETCTIGAGLDPLDPESGDAGLPDGWLIRYGLDPFDSGIAEKVTQTASADPGPRLPEAPDFQLKVRDEYAANRPESWNETRDGPWWGGSDPNEADTDGDGLGDAWEARGYEILVAADVGGAQRKPVTVRPSPTSPDSDADGLGDLAEAEGIARPRTDATRRDTDLDGLADGAELSILGLDPTLADTAHDLLTDGTRYNLLAGLSSGYAADDSYSYAGAPGVTRRVRDWLAHVPGAEGLSTIALEDVRRILGPQGDVDGDGTPNLIDSDLDGDGLLNGVEHDPALYARSSFGTGGLPGGRPATDPLNPDTDGDRLLDGWEVKHAHPNLQLGRLIPDPSRWDSDGNGVPDGQEDPDRDGIDWFTYRTTPQGIEAVENHFSFENLKEQDAQTNPYQSSTDADGLLDGWKVFWGLEYPNLIPGGTPGLGSIYPGGPDGPLAIETERPKPVPGVPQRDEDISKAPLSTLRLAPYDGTLQGLLRPHETPGTIHLEIPRQDGTKQDVLEIRGSWPLTFNDIQAANSNPYVDDSDGDGLSDHWEWVHRVVPAHGSCLSIAGPNPTVPDDTADPDQDGLPNSREQALGTHPLCPDTDQGGLVDGEEVALALDPIDPRDDFFESGRDQDGDGLSDLVELRDRRTNALDPDTDGDGLLDGTHFPTSGGLPESDARVKRFLDLGIAYATTGAGPNLRYTLLGEASLSTDPLDRDPGGTGIPQGWLVAMGFDPAGSDAAPNVRDAYALSKPSWWDEVIHGVWWGGALQTEIDDPSSVNLTDLDADGLGDLNGEDPFPAVNHYNQLRSIDWTLHGIASPESTDPRLDELASTARQVLAQSLLNPRTTTGNRYGREPDPASLADDGLHVYRDRPELSDLALNTTQLHRGGTGALSGRVALNGTGVPGLTIVAELAEQVVAVAFSDEDGRFSAVDELLGQHEMTIPPEAFSFLGETGGTIRWSTDPAAFPIGAAQLRVRTYATPNTIPHTDRWPALESTAELLDVEVFATPRISLQLPLDPATGEPIRIDARVVDGAGAPLREPVRLVLPFTQATTTPDRNGAATFTITIPHESAGEISMTVTTIPTSSWVSEATHSASLVARRPAALAAAVQSPVRAGESVEITGRVTAPGAAVSDVSIRASIEDAFSQATSRGDGSFQVLFTIPPSLPGGTHPLLIEAARSGTTLAASRTLIVEILGRPRVEIDANPIQLGSPAIVSGRLLRPAGEPLAGVSLSFELDGQMGMMTTAEDGRFSAAVNVTRVGQVFERIAYAGDEVHAPGSASLQRTVLSPTRLEMAAGEVRQGAPARVEVGVRDALNRPLAGSAVRLRWEARDASAGITDSAGRVVFTEPTSESPLGPYRVVATFDGSADGTLLPSRADNVWRVRSAVEFLFPEAPIVAGASAPLAQLVDAGTRQGISGLPVEIESGGHSRQAETGTNGSFAPLPNVPRDALPGPVMFGLRFNGTANYPPATATYTVHVRSPSQLEAGPGAFVRGSESSFPVRLLDGGARGIDGRVDAWLGDSAVGSGQCIQGACLLSVRVPAGHALGDATMRLAYAGDMDHVGSELSVPSTIRRQSTVRAAFEPERGDGFARIHVLATSEGEPLPNADVFIALEGMAGGFATQTDDRGQTELSIPPTDRARAFAVRLDSTGNRTGATTTGTLSATLEPVDGAQNSWWPWAATLGAALLAAAGLVYWRRRRTPLEETLREVRRLIKGRGPVEAGILAAYDALDRAAAGQGWLQGQAVTPRTLGETLQSRVPATVHPEVDAVLSLFEEARYGRTRMDEAHRERALSALGRIMAASAWRGTS